MRIGSVLLVALTLVLSACSSEHHIMGNLTYTHDVQFVHFRFDQTEARGPVEVDGAVVAFRTFPFKQQQEEARSLREPTFPTVSFRSHPDGAVLAIWSLEPDQYEVYVECAGAKITVEETDPNLVEQYIRDFFSGKRTELLERLSAAPSAVYKRSFIGQIKALFGLS